MITLNNLTMGFSQRTLFKGVSLSIFPNEKIGLTGPNGAGKSTLFSIILGKIEPVEGNIQIQKSINIGYLPQEAKFSSSRTVMEELTEGDGRIKELVREKRYYEDNNKADSQRYGDILEELERLGIYDLEHKAEKILSGLGFKEQEFHKPINQLSGGWQMRTLLAKLLTYEYDLILLDEPTNYLDLEATLWLKDFLSSYPGAFVLISHDRVFLNDVTNYTIVLDNGQMTKIKGNYEAYEQQKGIDQKFLERQQKVIEKKRQQLERFTQRFHAQPNRASAVKNKRKMIERLEKIDIPQDRKSMMGFDFGEIKQSGYVVAKLEGVSKSYGDLKIYDDLDLEIVKNQKVCFVGPNGAGKSTLLKMIAGVVKNDKGSIRYGHNVDVGYFSQSRLDVLNPERSVYDEVLSAAPAQTPALKVRTLMGLFNFHGDDVFKTVRILSGGEKSRVVLAKLLINPPNFILLDEPTTHLDLDGVKALTSAFQDYEGTLCFISHDLYFIREIADCIVKIEAGGITSYPGGLDYYLEKKEQQLLESEQGKKNNNKDGSSTGDKKNKNNSNQRIDKLHQAHNKAKNRLADIKSEIKFLNDEQKELDTESYVKNRLLQKAYETSDSLKMKECGKRLKEIQSRLREIEVQIKQLNDEKNQINK